MSTTLTQFTREQLRDMIFVAETPTTEEIKAAAKERGLTLGRKGSKSRQALEASLAVDLKHAWRDDQQTVVDQLNVWLLRGDSVAVYRNIDMCASSFGRRVFMSYGSSAAQIERDEPPTKMPDTGQFGTPWGWDLEGTYKGQAL